MHLFQVHRLTFNANSCGIVNIFTADNIVTALLEILDHVYEEVLYRKTQPVRWHDDLYFHWSLPSQLPQNCLH